MRLFGKLLATLTIIVLLVLTISVALLHTRHAAPVIGQLTRVLSNYQFDANALSYTITDPWHLTIEQPTVIDPDQQIHQAQQVQLWLAPRETLFAWFGLTSSSNPTPSYQTQPAVPLWYFDSILISGVDIAHVEQPNHQPSQAQSEIHYPAIFTHRLALKQMNLTTPRFTLHNGQVQLDNWQPSAAFWGDFSGDFRIAAPQVDWQQHTFTDLLVDGEKTGGYQADEAWRIYGYSFDWLGASINGQANFLPDSHQWILDQITVANLQFESALTTHQLAQQAHDLITNTLINQTSDHNDDSHQVATTLTIGRLDVVDSQIELADLSLNQLNLSLLNWQQGKSRWQQSDSQLSLSADSILWHETVFDSPLLDLRFTPNTTLIEGLSSKVWQGYLRTKGKVTPNTIHLNQLTLNNIKAFLAPQWPSQLNELFAPYDAIDIQTLDVGYLQLTDTNPELPFQLSGINIDGSELRLKQSKHYGLWQGRLTASAGFASINTVELVEPYISTHSQAGNWQLDQLTLPFKNGLLEATGQWALTQPAQPWHITATTDSAPLSILPQWLGLPLPLEGKVDSSIALSGLAHNRASFNYSLEGAIQADFRDAHLLSTPAEFSQQLANWRANPTQISQEKIPTLATYTSIQATPSTASAIAISPLTVTSDRGRIALQAFTIKNTDIQTVLEGQWDLAQPQKQKLRLNVAQSCQLFERVWQHHQQPAPVSLSSCDGNSI
ncbi:AsmA family protein [Photobacterium kagoshimensis]|uniref:AsmA family protein n=1 Tax=Photobacterium kagoshimensis TaxID=2910242 RepID=UPI003D0A165A